MTEFIEILRARIPARAKWTIMPVRVDLTNGMTNLLVGLLLTLPFSVSWFACYLLEWNSIALAWSVILVPAGVWTWLGRPMSRPHMCAREIELAIAVMLFVVSGGLTLVHWLESPNRLVAVLQWLGL